MAGEVGRPQPDGGLYDFDELGWHTPPHPSTGGEPGFVPDRHYDDRVLLAQLMGSS